MSRSIERFSWRPVWRKLNSEDDISPLCQKERSIFHHIEPEDLRARLRAHKVQISRRTPRWERLHIADKPSSGNPLKRWLAYPEGFALAHQGDAIDFVFMALCGALVSFAPADRADHAPDLFRIDGAPATNSVVSLNYLFYNAVFVSVFGPAQIAGLVEVCISSAGQGSWTADRLRNKWLTSLMAGTDSVVLRIPIEEAKQLFHDHTFVLQGDQRAAKMLTQVRRRCWESLAYRMGTQTQNRILRSRGRYDAVLAYLLAEHVERTASAKIAGGQHHVTWFLGLESIRRAQEEAIDKLTVRGILTRVGRQRDCLYEIDALRAKQYYWHALDAGD